MKNMMAAGRISRGRMEMSVIEHGEEVKWLGTFAQIVALTVPELKVARCAACGERCEAGERLCSPVCAPYIGNPAADGEASARDR